MPVELNPYLSFRDDARPAMEFYREIFGGTLTVSTFAENQASPDPGEGEKVMHADLEAPGGIRFMASDTPNSMEYRTGSNISMSLSGDDEPTLSRFFERLAAGGTVAMPLEKAPWGDTFGMCTDRFGVNWMVNITSTTH